MSSSQAVASLEKIRDEMIQSILVEEGDWIPRLRIKETYAARSDSSSPVPRTIKSYSVG